MYNMLECGESRMWALHSDYQNNAIMNRSFSVVASFMYGSLQTLKG